MKKLEKGSDTGYRITDTGEGYYYVLLSDEKANEVKHYQYDSCCGSLEEVENYLKKHTYNTIVKAYRDMCVYCECTEQIY